MHHFVKGNGSPATQSYLLYRDAFKVMAIFGRLLPLAYVPDPPSEIWGFRTIKCVGAPHTNAHQILRELKLF